MLSTISMPLAYSGFIVYALLLIVISLFLAKKNALVVKCSFYLIVD